MSLVDTRRHQMFPVLDELQIGTAKRFASGEPRQFAPGEVVFEVGERAAPSWLVLEGAIEVSGRDGLAHEVAITTHGPGQMSGELSQLTGRASLATGRAGPAGCTAVPFDAAHLRALVVGSAEVGEVIMRAFIRFPDPDRAVRADDALGPVRRLRLLRLVLGKNRGGARIACRNSRPDGAGGGHPLGDPRQRRRGVRDDADADQWPAAPRPGTRDPT